VRETPGARQIVAARIHCLEIRAGDRSDGPFLFQGRSMRNVAKVSPNSPAGPDRVTLGEVSRRLNEPRSSVYLDAIRGSLPVIWNVDRFEMERADLDRLVAERASETEAPDVAQAS
jgi:hypothetical protein